MNKKALTTKEEFLDCAVGLYKIHWKNDVGGGFSYASVGINRSGNRWIAPSNWSSGSDLLKNNIVSIDKMELIAQNRKEVKFPYPNV